MNSYMKENKNLRKQRFIFILFVTVSYNMREDDENI